MEMGRQGRKAYMGKGIGKGEEAQMVRKHKTQKKGVKRVDKPKRCPTCNRRVEYVGKDYLAYDSNGRRYWRESYWWCRCCGSNWTYYPERDAWELGIPRKALESQ